MSKSRKSWFSVTPMRFAGLLALFLFMLTLIIVLLVFVPQIGKTEFGIESQMVLAIILGTAVFLSTITFVTTIFSHLRLQNKFQALGLPEGSVRAIIALCLIILFVIMSIYLFNSTGAQPPRRIENASWYNGTAFVPVPYNGTAYIPREPSDAQIDIAKSLITTVGTLVVALAGFYFGTRAKEVPKEAADRTLVIVSPAEDPYVMPSGKNTVDITVKATPDGESVTWETPPEGDKDGTLVQIEPNKFRYTKGSAPEDEVILRFKLSRYPDVKAKLTVNIVT